MRVRYGVMGLLGLTLVQCDAGEAPPPVAASREFLLPASPERYQPLAGFGVMELPADNPLTLAKARLGRQLFFDPALSGDGSRSCSSCHLNEHGLAEPRPTAVGAFGKLLTRNSPTLWNIGFHWLFYWDGRKDTLEGQVAAAWKGGNMGAAEHLERIAAELSARPRYQEAFAEVFGEPASADNVPQALAAYLRTIVGGQTAYDRWQAGDEDAVSVAARRGHEVFERARCDDCHAGRLLTDLVFHNVGIGYDPATGSFADEGRFVASGEERDRGAFKTPTLRDVVDSGPYFHDGSVADLEAAVRLMAAGGIPNPHLDEGLRPVELSDGEIADLMEFLQSLDEEGRLEPPPGD